MQEMTKRRNPEVLVATMITAGVGMIISDRCWFYMTYMTHEQSHRSISNDSYSRHNIYL